MAINNPQDFAAALLKRLGYNVTPQSVKAVVGWQRAEGGNWNNSARFNPLNTTQNEPGATSINSVGVKSYGSWDQGLNATVQTLKNGRYGGILKALQAGNPGQVAEAIGSSPWGTSADLISRVMGSTPAGPVPKTATPTPAPTASTTKTVPGVDRSELRRSLIADFIGQGGTNNDNALIALATQLPGAADIPAKTKIVPATGQPDSSPLTAPGSAPDAVRTLIERANQIDAKHYNYEWGGGHNPSHSPTHGYGHGSGPGIGFDCSGVVSKVLGVDARVASDFMRWGKPGKGKNVTVYSSGSHVFLEINNHFFGTSGSNPGGGAGWIPAGALSPSYLAGFVKRHPTGL